jgi:hypothetical protein
MITFNINSKKIIMIITAFVLTFLTININAQINPYIYFKDGVFKYNCDTIYPMVMNYGIQRIKVYSNDPHNEVYHITPTRGFCHTQNCGVNDEQRTCGQNALEWKEEMIEQFVKIEELHFKMIRVIDLMELRLNTKSLNPFIETSQYLIQRENLVCNDKANGLSVNELNDFAELGDLLQEVIDALNESGTDLKLIVLMGGHGVEMLSNVYKDYLSYIAHRFRNEPRIFAYDLYNEPIWFVYPQNPYPDKYQIADMCKDWYDAIKIQAPSHFITMGLEIYDVRSWDPQIIPLDFISFHHYQRPKDFEQYSINPPLSRFKTWFKWLSNTITQPYIIGETGLPGINVEDLADPPTIWPPYWPSRQEQANYANFTIQYSKLFKTLGYSWYDYKDKYTWAFSDDSIGDNFLGIVYNEDPPYNDIETAKAEVGNIFLSFNPNSNDCFDVLIGNNCIEPGDEYFHPNPEIYQLNQLMTGYIYDENEIGLEDVFVQAGLYDDNKGTWPTSFAITNKFGYFVIWYTIPNPNAYVNKLIITYPGKETLELNNLQNINYIETVLYDLDPNLLPPKASYESYNIENNTSEIWDTQRYLPYKEITIKDGAVLTVMADVFLDEDAKIVVERKGKLVVDGGRITCSCGMWKGIEVWGDPAQQSSNSYQGWVVIQNEGTIENAIVGIRTVKVEENGGEGFVNLNFAGGIVQTVNANFINNKEAIHFFKYPAIGYTYQNTSFINTTLFETNENYIGSSNPQYFVNLSDINKVSFKSCEFIYNNEQSNFQSGIYSINSQFYIEGNLQGSSYQNTLFDNLNYGVYAIATNPNRFADIRHTTFNLNFRGLYISGMTLARVTSNKFNTNAPFSPLGGYGMYLNVSTGYWVEDNDFYHEGLNSTGVGIIVHNSGVKSNEIYNNRFSNLSLGISAQEQNCELPGGPPRGLQILCNDFDVCAADVLVPRPRNSTWGIAANQGSDSQNPADMAGNLFYIPSQTPDGDFDDINNQGRHVTYYFPLNNNDYDVRPVDLTDHDPYNTVKLEERTVEPDDWTPENGCPPGIEGGGGGGIGSGELKMKIAEAQQKIDSTENLLTILVDGGDTDELQTEVDNSIPPEAMAIYTELIDNSPYLSDTVVSTAIEKEDVLPGAMIRDVMVANPNTAKNDVLMNKLDERWTPLPEYMKEQILQGKNIVSVKERTESKLAKYILDKSRAMNAMARNYRNDTVEGVDSLAMLYASDNSLESKYRLAFLSMEQGAWSMGMTTLYSIPSQFELSVEQQAEYENFVEFYNLLASMNGLVPDSIKVEELTGIMEQEIGEASMFALNMLIDLGEVEYYEPIEMPDYMKSTTVDGSFTSIINTAAPQSLKVMPNPAKDYIIVEYELELAGKGLVEICDVSGKPIHSVQVTNIKDQLTIDTRYWNKGIYIALLKINGKKKETVKFTVTD